MMIETCCYNGNHNVSFSFICEIGFTFKCHDRKFRTTLFFILLMSGVASLEMKCTQNTARGRN